LVQLVDIYVFVLGATAAVALGVAFVAWTQRSAPTAWSVVVLMLGVTIWCGSEAMMWSSPSLGQQAFWLKVTYPAVSIALVGFITFAVEIAEVRQLTDLRGTLLIVAPLTVISILGVTNPGGLFYAGYTLQRIGTYTHYAAQNGPLFWVYIVVGWGMLLLGVFAIFRTHLASTRGKRALTGSVLIAVSFPIVVSAVNQFQPFQIEGIESTAFFLTGLILLHVLVRGQLLHPNGHLVTARDVVAGELRELELRSTNQELGDRLEASRHHADRLYDQATHDPLTNLANRRSLESDLVREVARTQRTDAPIAFIMFDLDEFKTVNDRYSHLAGDAALKMVSEVLLRGSRQVDIICRWGGDEFLVVMPEADVEAARRRAEDLRDQIAGTMIHFDGYDFSITATIGVSVFPKCGTTATSAIRAADRALYFAKERGGNRIAVSDPEGPRLADMTCEYGTT
jgi:diguanylate cyclase (GGDEF)-like protein